MLKINNFIRASEVRVIDEEGKNLGVLPLEKALQVAREAGLDLIEVSSNVVPPITKIMDKGKYLYEQDKKKRQAAKNRKEVEIKNVRIGIGTGAHDLELKARQIDEFLKEGNRAQVELRLKGREKYLKKEFLEERIQRVLNMVSQPFSIEPVKKGPRGLMLTIAPKK
ncbi:translation initiation factor IF-3 [Candidatus Giovannonibacteria bacterium]|nr:translation initiation factor IF-3 [Candidatus Giovannonibacteria bacterium]